MTTDQTSDSLYIRDVDKQVVLHPEDDDLFVRTGRQVIEACRLGISIEVWQHEVGEMIQRVRAWAAAQSKHVRACFVCPRGTKLVLYVIPRSDAFDFDLADELVELHRQVMREFPAVGPVEVLQIPGWESDRYMGTREARPIHANP